MVSQAVPHPAERVRGIRPGGIDAGSDMAAVEDAMTAEAWGVGGVDVDAEQLLPCIHG